MKVATGTCLVLMWLLTATIYWNNSHSVVSHTLWDCYGQTCCTTRITPKRTPKRIWNVKNDSKQQTHILNNIFLIPPL